MKYSDDMYDEKHDNVMSSFLGVLCALTCAVATISNAGAAYIFIAILIGNLIAFKVDGIHHIITLLVFVVMCLFFNIPTLSIVILLVCIFAALFDEVGHELISKITDNKFLHLFFEYRFVMKIVILLLAAVGVFNIFIFLCFLLFEVFYEMAGIVFKTLN